jgi:ribosome maturation factor RimP
MIKMYQSTKNKPKFIWFPEVGEKVEVRKKCIPQELRSEYKTIMGKIIDIESDKITIRIKKSDITLVFSRNQLVPFGNFYKKKLI